MKTRFHYLISTFFVALLFTCSLFSQQTGLPEYREFQKAVQKGTRTRDGIPGPRYRQNSSDYKIEASLDTTTDIIRGTETILYHNTSLDTLKNLSLRVYQELYNKENARLSPIPAENLTDGVIIDSLKIDGKIYIKDNKALDERQVVRQNTLLILRTVKPLKSDSTAKIELAWQFRVPAIRSDDIDRMGRYGKAFFVGLWYPQMAVYDDIEGWDVIPHLGILEFYNDFSNYDVTVTVPEGYVVWATGACSNPAEVLKPEILDRVQKAASGDDNIKVITKADYKTGVTTGNKWHFKATHVPDFAFATAPDYVWESTSFVADHQTGRRVQIDLVRPTDSLRNFNAVNVTRDALKWSSDSFPGVPFPYEHATVFINTQLNSSAMEFPMMVNNSDYSFPYLYNAVIAHELYHNYMPFYMGFNETRYMWFDEGFTQFNESKFKGDKMSLQDMSIMNYPNQAGKIDDHPLMDFSVDYNMRYLDFSSYFKPCNNLILLETLLGPAEFKRATLEFMKNWNGKHPTPYDMFYSYSHTTGQDLNWFWKACYFDRGYADLAIKSVNKKAIIIEKRGNIPEPVYLQITYADKTNEKVFRNLDIWKNGQTQYIVKLKGSKEIKKVKLGNNTTPDAVPADNEYKVK
jgi:hypothetical protein